MNLVGFEDCADESDGRHWYFTDVMEMFGYRSRASFQKVVNKAMSTCASLNIDIAESFVACRDSGKGAFKFNRFACYLIAMQSDEKKPEVKAARVYLAEFASSVMEEVAAANDLGRIELREELKTSEKMMSGVAQQAGLRGKEFAFFKDAGYRGMYNMPLSALKRRKGLEKGVLYDFMCQTELAANFFRVTQTSERVKSYRLRGVKAVSESAEAVGGEVRRMMKKNSGVLPEDIPLTEHVKEAHKRLKTTARKMKLVDKS